MLQCDKCGKHAPLNDDTDAPPSNWVFIRFGDFDAVEPIDCAVCEECKLSFFSSVGLTGAAEYSALSVAYKNNAVRTMNKAGVLIRALLHSKDSDIKNVFDVN